MQETFASDPTFSSYSLVVDSVTVFKKPDGTYKGIASVEYKGSLHDVMIDVDTQQTVILSSR